jgi:hypothetical protein
MNGLILNNRGFENIKSYFVSNVVMILIHLILNSETRAKINISFMEYSDILYRVLEKCGVIYAMWNSSRNCFHQLRNVKEYS